MSGTLHPQYGALPWHVAGYSATVVYTRDGGLVAEVAFIRGLPHESMARERAIARLIAAAPALLEAAEKALSTLQCGRGFAGQSAEEFDNWCGHADMVERELSAALALVDGKEQA